MCSYILKLIDLGLHDFSNIGGKLSDTYHKGDKEALYNQWISMFLNQFDPIIDVKDPNLSNHVQGMIQQQTWEETCLCVITTPHTKGIMKGNSVNVGGGGNQSITSSCSLLLDDCNCASKEQVYLFVHPPRKFAGSWYQIGSGSSVWVSPTSPHDLPNIDLMDEDNKIVDRT